MSASPETDAALPDRLARAITLAGPISLAQFMRAANTHYYATRDPLGPAGDFTTAPEISQMVGELVGAWMADLAQRAARTDIAYGEIGPGRGTLAADALRVLRRAGLAPPVHLVEASPVLRVAQADRHPDATWHERIVDLPTARPLLVVANEFFDCLPVRQLIRTQTGWRERLIACQDTLFLPVPGREVHDGAVPPHLHDAAIGAILETSPDAVDAMRALSRTLIAAGGAALILDYGYEGPALGDSMQAVSRHRHVNPFEEPGSRDLTAHVDFATLAAAAAAEGCRASAIVTQREWLGAMGIDARAAALARANPNRAEAILGQRTRLMDADGMGGLFRVLAVTAPGWPDPEGFA